MKRMVDNKTIDGIDSKITALENNTLKPLKSEDVNIEYQNGYLYINFLKDYTPSYIEIYYHNDTKDQDKYLNIYYNNSGGYSTNTADFLSEGIEIIGKNKEMSISYEEEDILSKFELVNFVYFFEVELS